MLGPYLVPSLKIILVDLYTALSDWNYPDCAAPYWRLYWNAAGRGVVSYVGQRYALEGDAVLMIPPETRFSTEVESPMDHLFMHFLAGPPYDGARPRVVASRADAGELAQLGELARAVGVAGSGERAAAEGDRSTLFRAAALCHRCLARFPLEALPSTDGGGVAARVAEFVRSRLSEPPSNSRIARELGVSVPTLERALRSSEGRSLHAYALWLRINEACIRLRHTDDSVEEVAEALGFADRSHFCRAFSRLRGESPSVYRASSP